MTKDISSGYERLAKRTGEHILQLPFECHHCKRKRYDLEMIDGDGYPLCVECIDKCVAILKGEPLPCDT